MRWLFSFEMLRINNSILSSPYENFPFFWSGEPALVFVVLYYSIYFYYEEHYRRVLFFVQAALRPNVAFHCFRLVKFLKRIKVKTTETREKSQNGGSWNDGSLVKTDEMMTAEMMTAEMTAGEMVAAMHGANAPLMKIMVAEQMERERRIQAGQELRRGIPIHEAVPGTEPATSGQSIISASLISLARRTFICTIQRCLRFQSSSRPHQ
jgi:hypothetical protein